VKNLTLTDSVYRLLVRVGVAHETDVDRAADVLQTAANSIAWLVLKEVIAVPHRSRTDAGPA
jgi:small-conductance mechanosensitive channel